MLKVLELFSGVGCQTQALKNIGIEHQSTQCEIDKYAESIYNQIHGETENLGDITKVDENTLSKGQWDLITYSFPCTNISVAGQQEGLEKNSGTASSLLWECERIIRKVKPTYLLMENVKNLLSKKHIHNFEDWLKILEGMGYKNYYKVLNAKDFGVPQNRERVFCVSILGEHEPYEFPNGFPLTLRLKDMLEDNVEAKYYLSEKIQQRFKMKPQGDSIIGTTAPEFRTIGQRDIVYNTDGTMGALVATDYKQPKQIIEFDMPNGKKAEFDDSVTEPNCFKEVRTEEGKLARKIARQQGFGDTTPRNKESKKFITKDDGVANCLTTTCGVEQIIVEPTKTLELKKGTIVFIPNEYNSYTKYVFEKDVVINLEEPTLNYLGGIGEPNRLNDGKELSRNYKEGYRVYDSNGLSATIKANGGGLGGCSGLYMVNEPFIVASRGRYTDKENPSQTEQCFEINDSGLTNTITTVQKDNYVVEPQINVEKIGYFTYPNSDKQHQSNIVISSEGLSPTLDTCGGGSRPPKILDNPSLIVHNVVQPVTVRKYEVDVKSLKNVLRISKHQSGLTNKRIAELLNVPLTKVEHWFRTDNSFAIPDAEIWYELKNLLKIETNDFDESITTFEEKDGVYEKANRCYHEDGLSPTLTATSSNEKIICEQRCDEGLRFFKDNICGTLRTTNACGDKRILENNYKIRKLTPKECYRLMGWKDEQFDKIQGISDAQLYKTAGNGIVIPVLEAIFEKMFK